MYYICHQFSINKLTINLAIMKKTIFAICLLGVIFFNSCDKQEPQMFEEPYFSWSSNKNDILNNVNLTLIENNAASDIVYLSPPFTSKGDGSLKYSSNNFFKEISYGFYNSNKTLEVVYCIVKDYCEYDRTQILEYMKKTYGGYNEYINTSVWTGYESHSYEFQHEKGIVVLNYYSASTTRIIFAPIQYQGEF